VDRIW